jgi:hypothetical protein
MPPDVNTCPGWNQKLMLVTAEAHVPVAERRTRLFAGRLVA